MENFFITFAKQNEEADKEIIAILSKMSNADREKSRKSYYGSLSGLVRHVLGGTVYFLSMFTETAGKNAAALKALGSLSKIEMFNGVKKLDEDQWEKICAGIKIADKAYVNFVSALSGEDMNAPVKLDWYKGKPGTVPLGFMLEQLVAHNIHHRGQISQILDSLKIDNDYSGINLKFL